MADEGGNGKIVPTRVGVNRRWPKQPRARVDCPHACGGEPKRQDDEKKALEIVPTRVGVNRAPARPRKT